MSLRLERARSVLAVAHNSKEIVSALLTIAGMAPESAAVCAFVISCLRLVRTSSLRWAG